jgi:hypothetical protein
MLKRNENQKLKPRDCVFYLGLAQPHGSHLVVGERDFSKKISPLEFGFEL